MILCYFFALFQVPEQLAKLDEQGVRYICKISSPSVCNSRTGLIQQLSDFFVTFFFVFLFFQMTNQYKVGVLYAKNGQGTEEEMYNNRE